MIDVNKPVTNPQLDTAIKQMRENNTKENLDYMIDEVMKAHFISPVVISPAPGQPGSNNQVILKQDTAINFSIIGNKDNQQFFLAFTNWDELRKWHNAENQQTLIMTFDDLASMVLNKNSNIEGFVINPFGGNVMFNKTMIASLKAEKERRASGGVVEQVVKEDTTVQLGQPRVYPKELVNAISGYLKTQKSVQAAYLQLMIKEGEHSYLIIVDFTGDRREIFDGINKASMKYLKGMFINFVPYDCDFGRSAAKDIEPFYRKKKFGIF